MPAIAQRLASRSALLTCALFAGAGALAAGDYGASMDAETQQRIALRALDYILGRNQELLTHKDRLYGPVFELLLLGAERLLRLEDAQAVYLSRHLLTHLFFLAAGLCGAQLAYDRYGRRGLAWAFLLLFLLHPRLYAHSFFNSKDVPFLSLFLIVLWLTHRAFRQNTARAFLLCGVGAGLLISVRLPGFLLGGAVLAARLCDLCLAPDRAARRRVLHTSAAFALAAALALYAAHPYLWTAPQARLAELAGQTARFANNRTLNLFQGALFWETELPPRYVPAWFAVTTPLPALLLGLVGMLTLGQRVGAQAGAALRNTPLRFDLLLLACVIGPALAVILLNSSLYNGWRHMYFLYAPFSLLALRGLHALTGARPPRLRAAARGAVGLGAGATVAAMICLHPYQHVYFNGLVDRATPERLRTRYPLDYWGTSLREAFAVLLARYPARPVRAYASVPAHVNRNLLARAERQRITLPPGEGEAAADFYVTDYRENWGSGPVMPPVYAPLIYARQAYRNTLFAIAAVNLDRVDATTARPYRAAYQAAVRGAPAARGAFDVYLDRDAARLTFVQKPCQGAALAAKFFVHAEPVTPYALPPAHRSVGFENRDFRFERRGVRFDDVCLARVSLPAYPLQSLRVGQWTARDGNLWAVAVPVQAAQAAQRRAAQALSLARASGPPAVRAPFDVYALPETVIFVKDPCRPADTQAKFILHFVPVARRDLAARPRAAGFENHDFQFAWYGAPVGAACVAQVPLPAYPLQRLRVGQFDSQAQRVLWQNELPGAAFAAAP